MEMCRWPSEIFLGDDHSDILVVQLIGAFAYMDSLASEILGVQEWRLLMGP